LVHDVPRLFEANQEINMSTPKPETPKDENLRFSFFKGGSDIIAPKDNVAFDWDQSAARVREHLADAMSAKNVAFLFGSGCSSYLKGGVQVGIPTMAPLAQHFLSLIGGDKNTSITDAEKTTLQDSLGVKLDHEDFSANLERLVEVLQCGSFLLHRTSKTELIQAAKVVSSVLSKVQKFIYEQCTVGPFTTGDETVLSLYQAFYRKLIYRDQALPRPWVFTTNYDLFNEQAMDRLGVPYCNGFSGVVERHFNPAVFRYTLAEQIDVASRKWTAVDNFVYLCKLHGSVSWIEDGKGLFPFCELQQAVKGNIGKVMIYPTPAKQNASLGSPYSDLFREFHSRVVKEQSVLISVGYSYGDEHINNLIFQALTIPTFRLIALAPPNGYDVVSKLRGLNDPRVWVIGGDGPSEGRRAHYFDVFIEKFMPEAPGGQMDSAVAKILETLVRSNGGRQAATGSGVDE
jgi:hypothetical protein